MNRIKVRIAGTDDVRFFNIDEPDERIAFGELIEKEGCNNIIVTEVDAFQRVKYLCMYEETTNTFVPNIVRHCIFWARDELDAAKAAAVYFDLKKEDAYKDIIVEDMWNIPVEVVSYPDLPTE